MEFLNDECKVSGELWRKGWAERNAGNISMRLTADDRVMLQSSGPGGPWSALPKKVEGLRGDLILISGTGKYLKNIAGDPERNLGIIEINDSGEKFRTLWGFSDGGSPSCELPSHLEVHSIKKTAAPDSKSTIIHTHPANLVALTYALELDTFSLTKLLWEMHAECMAVFPEGIEFLPWMVAGSNELADATADAFAKRNAVLWQFHGAFGWGRNPDEALGLVDTMEKAAEIYLKAVSAGPVRNRLKAWQLAMIAERFGVTPDPEIMERMKII
jgi:rhamnulose-1-phosphate aldolase